jgi:hypothetical protein
MEGLLAGERGLFDEAIGPDRTAPLRGMLNVLPPLP